MQVVMFVNEILSINEKAYLLHAQISAKAITCPQLKSHTIGMQKKKFIGKIVAFFSSSTPGTECTEIGAGFFRSVNLAFESVRF